MVLVENVGVSAQKHNLSGQIKALDSGGFSDNSKIIDEMLSQGASLITSDRIINSVDDSLLGKTIPHNIAVFAELNKNLIIKNITKGYLRVKAQSKHMCSPKAVSDIARNEACKLIESTQKLQALLSHDYSVSRTTIKRIVEGH